MGASKAHAFDRRANLNILPAAPARQALLVLGMHRSGTSALTRVLGLCGGALPRHKMAAADSNALGFWEPQPIVDAHDRFLRAAGTDWEAIADYPASLFTSERAAACRRSLADLAVREYGDAPLFILKDPRISRLMPLWRPVLDELGVAPRIVIMVRNPLEIAESLKLRDGWSEHRACIVWLRYLLTAERDTRDLPRCVVGYGQLMNDWRATVARLSDQLGVPLPNITEPGRSPAVEREIDAFIRPDLRHHRHGADALFQRGDIADCVKQAYRCLSDAAETGTVDHAALDRIAVMLDNAEETLERITHSGGRPIQIRGVAQDIAHGPTMPDAGDTLTALMLAEIERANDVAERSQRLVSEMRGTWSWRFTKPLRALGRTAGRVMGKRA